MTLFSTVLFIHVLCAITLFIAIAFEGAILARLRAAQSVEQLRDAVRASRRLGGLYGPAFLGILFGGIYLAAELHIRAAWVPLALGATLLMGIVSGVTTGRKMSRLRKALEQQNSATGPVASIAHGNTLVVSYGLRAGLAVGIVYLMSAMPTLIPSLLALAIASVLGIVLALRFKRTAGVELIRTRSANQPSGM